MVVATDILWEDPSYWSEPAEQAFARVRRQARRERHSTLASFDEIEKSAGLLPESIESHQVVPLTRIVGSVGKDRLFTRSFLPKFGKMRGRWKRAFAVAHGLRGYQPVELYDVDGRFYVVDGHFRISVVRALGNETIQARVRRWV